MYCGFPYFHTNVRITHHFYYVAMPIKQIRIDLNTIATHRDLIECLPAISTYENGDQAYFTINLNCNKIYGDYLTLIVSYIKLLRHLGIESHGIFKDFNVHADATQYASRINFFEHVGLPVSEDFTRVSSEGRFVEITSYTAQNAYQGHMAILRIINANMNVDPTVLAILDTSLWEIIDNVYTHAESPTHGIMSAQTFPYIGEIRAYYI